MAKISSLKTDVALESEGVWVDYEEGIRLKLRRFNNPEMQAFMRREAGTAARRFRVRAIMSDSGVSALQKKATAKFVLVGWENVEDDEGKPIPYSWEKALEFFEDPQLDDFYNFVIAASGDQSLYRKENVEESLGNS